MDTTAQSPQFTASTFDRNRHNCAFFYSIDEQHRVLRPFIKDGFDRGHKAFHLGFEQILQSGPAAGYAQTRFLAQMEWALVDLPGVDDLIEFETRVNYVVPKYENAVICAYDLTKFGASVVMDALRTHPVVIIGGLLQENPFFVPPDQLLLEIRERRSVHKSANTAH